MNRKLIVTLLALAAAPLAQAEMYKWTDAKGAVHYSQSPPPRGKFEAVAPHAPPPTASPNLDAMRKSLDESDKKAATDAKAAVETASSADAVQRKQYCAQARERLEYINNNDAHHMASKLPNGDYERWTDEKYESEKAQAKQRVEKNC